MTTEEKIFKADQLAEYGSNPSNSPDYRTSFALASIALYMSALFSLVPEGAIPVLKDEIDKQFQQSQDKKG